MPALGEFAPPLPSPDQAEALFHADVQIVAPLGEAVVAYPANPFTDPLTFEEALARADSRFDAHRIRGCGRARLD
jgi:hypothetical protein